MRLPLLTAANQIRNHRTLKNKQKAFRTVTFTAETFHQPTQPNKTTVNNLRNLDFISKRRQSAPRSLAASGKRAQTCIRFGKERTRLGENLAHSTYGAIFATSTTALMVNDRPES